MEDIQENDSLEKTKITQKILNKNLNPKKISNHLPNHKRCNSEEMKNIPPSLEKFYVINLRAKGPSISKFFFKKNNISLKSGSMPKLERRFLEKFRSIIIERDKHEISNIKIKENKNDIKKNNQTLNYLNMNFFEKKNNLKDENFILNEKSPIQKDYISNDTLEIFNNDLNTNQEYQIYALNDPFKKEDESCENINQDDFSEGSNIQLSEECSFCEKNNEAINGEEDLKKEKKKEKQNSFLNDISENEDNYFKNETNFFSSPKINSKYSSNKSLKLDSKIGDNIIPYSKESMNNRKNSRKKIIFLKDLLIKIILEKMKVFRPI